MRIAIAQFVRLFAVLMLFAVVTRSSAAQYTPLYAFKGAPSDGSGPLYGSLASDGTFLYGFTPFGGVTNKGTVFKMMLNGSGYQVMHSFAGFSFIDLLLGGGGNTNDGVNPDAGPLLIGATLYGTSHFGGTNGYGAIFKINTDGTGFQLLHSFGEGLAGPNDGMEPMCTLVTDGTNLFGMTSASSADGAIFSISTNGSGYQMLHNFVASGGDGLLPQGSLALSGGVLYGMTQFGGTLNQGVIFSIGTTGAGYQVIHTFTDAANDGAKPYGSLTVSNSTLYGMTSTGGTNNVGAVFSMDTGGLNFKVLHSFSSADTWSPFGDVTLSGSTLYGMARNSGTSLLGVGTIFQVNTDGSGFQIPHVFSFSGLNLTDGSTPMGSLLLVGTQLYGMTQSGGSSKNAGTVFSFNPTGSGGGGSPVTALRVTILPSTAVKAGAQWQVNGGAFFNSGALASNLTSGAHVVSYKAVPGFITPIPLIIDIAAGVTNSATVTYNVADTTAPVLKIVSPTSKTVAVSNAFTATGTATDNAGVIAVYFRLNGGAWTSAVTANNWSNWTANLSLTAGPNTLNVYARDTSGNVSPTNSVVFTFTVSVPVTVTINIPGSGTVSPNLNGTVQAIDKTLKMSAKAAKGFAFANWTGATNTSLASISFVVASNQVFQANFKDITRPTDVILIPAKSQVLSNAVASGRAMDNVGVTAVYYKLNGGTWALATLAGTNWQTADLSAQLIAGPNAISSYAVDAAGNASLTNTIAFSYVVRMGADWAPNSLNGLLAVVSPNGANVEGVSFDAATFSQTAQANSQDPKDYGAGAYAYLKTDTNTAQLSLAFAAPPSNSNTLGPISLVFTNHYLGYFTNDSANFGGFDVSVANGVVPATVVGKTITVISGSSGKTTKIKLTSATAFTKSPANNSSSGSSAGTYTFTRMSPICGIFSATFTSVADAGQTAYLQLTFATANSGSYFVMVFDKSGVLQDIDTGTFTM